MDDDVIALLSARGAREISHPGGTLHTHLIRVAERLASWGARPALRRAGLAHAFYGTDGFPTALGDPADRAELTAVTGPETEALVYLYGSCDRSFTYSRLSTDGTFRDRFTGLETHPPRPLLRDFAELSVANELDIADLDPAFRARYGPALHALFASWDHLLSGPARRAVHQITAAP
ncbi:DUF6817 domain-containing protein [Actinocorallia populi]|uniref:DUF6817 domain-containing protein n=1 Tax=Actinocorallia populi TaxID=2079200 RepID=UPI000D08D7B8|nr:hypothetical protein [Actinocorallia populi]